MNDENSIRDALAGLVGWAQMILAQKDMPPDLRARFANNHRLTTAVLALSAARDPAFDNPHHGHPPEK